MKPPRDDSPSKNGAKASMSFKVLPKASLPDWIDQMSAGYRVVGPKPQHPHVMRGALRQLGTFGQDYGIEIWLEVHGSGTQLPANIYTIMRGFQRDPCPEELKPLHRKTGFQPSDASGDEWQRLCALAPYNHPIRH